MPMVAYNLSAEATEEKGEVMIFIRFETSIGPRVITMEPLECRRSALKLLMASQTGIDHEIKLAKQRV